MKFVSQCIGSAHQFCKRICKSQLQRFSIVFFFHRGPCVLNHKLGIASSQDQDFHFEVNMHFDQTYSDYDRGGCQFCV